jgi:hypothetical protein
MSEDQKKRKHSVSHVLQGLLCSGNFDGKTNKPCQIKVSTRSATSCRDYYAVVILMAKQTSHAKSNARGKPEQNVTAHRRVETKWRKPDLILQKQKSNPTYFSLLA